MRPSTPAGDAAVGEDVVVAADRSALTRHDLDIGTPFEARGARRRWLGAGASRLRARPRWAAGRPGCALAPLAGGKQAAAKAPARRRCESSWLDAFILAKRRPLAAKPPLRTRAMSLEAERRPGRLESASTVCRRGRREDLADMAGSTPRTRHQDRRAVEQNDPRGRRRRARRDVARALGREQLGTLFAWRPPEEHDRAFDVGDADDEASASRQRSARRRPGPARPRCGMGQISGLEVAVDEEDSTSARGERPRARLSAQKVLAPPSAGQRRSGPSGASPRRASLRDGRHGGVALHQPQFLGQRPAAPPSGRRKPAARMRRRSTVAVCDGGGARRIARRALCGGKEAAALDGSISGSRAGWAGGWSGTAGPARRLTTGCGRLASARERGRSWRPS